MQLYHYYVDVTFVVAYHGFNLTQVMPPLYFFTANVAGPSYTKRGDCAAVTAVAMSHTCACSLVVRKVTSFLNAIKYVATVPYSYVALSGREDMQPASLSILPVP